MLKREEGNGGDGKTGEEKVGKKKAGTHSYGGRWREKKG